MNVPKVFQQVTVMAEMLGKIRDALPGRSPTRRYLWGVTDALESAINAMFTEFPDIPCPVNHEERARQGMTQCYHCFRDLQPATFADRIAIAKEAREAGRKLRERP